MFSWFRTSQGRYFTFVGVTAATIGLSGAYFCSHTFLLFKYKEIVQMYGLGLEVPVSSKAKKCFEEVLEDLKLSEWQRKFIKPFTVFGFDMFHAGCTQTRTGAIIGIPSNFSYESTADVDRHQILVNLDQISWGSEAGKRLLDSLVLSDDAKKFAIGREISYVQTPYVYFHSIFPASVVLFIYGFTTNVNNKLGLLSRPLPLRLILYSLTSLFGFGSWAFMQDFTTVHYEARTDKEMASLGEKYIRGGIEFYSKVLQRNTALRKLMGSKGESMYTTTGNDQYLLRQKHMPLTIRKQFFEEQLQELINPEQNPTTAVSDQSGKTQEDLNIQIPSPA